LSFQIVIPTRDGGRWLAQFLAAYRTMHIEPLYIVDSRTNDNSISLLEELGANFRVFDGTADFVEGGALEFASRCMPESCEWTLRINDDEFPSKALLDWVAGDQKEKATSWALSRRDILRDGAAYAYSRYWSLYGSAEMPDYVNPQVRLYKHAHVKYYELIHSPGFIQGKYYYMPPDTYVMHFDVLLRDVNERIEKLRKYESARKGSSWKYGNHYLPEIVPREHNDPAPLGTSEFDQLIASLPLKPEADEVTFKTHELRQIRFGAFDRKAHEDAIAAHKQSVQGPASKRGGEFLCTLARVLARLPGTTWVADQLHAIGDGLQFRSRMRKSI
jgi:hypothetical protein